MSRDLSAHIGYPQQLVELLMLIATAPADGGDDLELVDAETIPAAASASLTRAGLREVWNSHLSAWPDPPADVTLVSQLLNAAGMDREAVVDWLNARAPTKVLDSLRGEVAAWTGNHAHVVVVASSRWRSLKVQSDPLVESIETEGFDLLAARVTET